MDAHNTHTRWRARLARTGAAAGLALVLLPLAHRPAAAQAVPTEAASPAAAHAVLMHLRPPRPPQARTHAQVFSAVDLGRWKQAYALARESREPMLDDVVSWIRFSTPGERISFEEAAHFIDTHPGWPEMGSLRANAEEAVTDATDADRLIAWFTRHPPLTAKGAFRYVEALQQRGRTDDARREARRAWVEMNFAARMERHFYRRFRRLLTADDHLRRLDRLLWDGRSWEARRMLRRVAAGPRAVAVARLRLRRFRGGVDRAIRRVPKDLLSDPGFVYERLRWRRRKGRDKEAIELLSEQPAKVARPALWWNERSALARRALRRGEAALAYGIAAGHRQVEGEPFADAEWLAGWIALRFLEAPDEAFRRFTRLYGAVRYPISRARAAYWAGRAREAAGDATGAERWFAKAAENLATFYGQLALRKLKGAGSRALPPEPRIDAATAEAFERRPLVRAARLIAASHDPAHFRAFTRQLADGAETAVEHALIARLANRVQRTEAALDAAKHAHRAGYRLMSAGWPRTTLPENLRGLDAAVLLALMRQESAFDNDAVSWAGAHGLMQVMPATARRIARRLKMPFSRKRLLSDPDYNMAIGTAYFAQMVKRFDGSYVLGLAAYNAGPSRVKRWLREFGDFRTGAADPVDWIEMIPYDQTRDYVQRVVENLVVYRAVLNGGEIRPEGLQALGL